MHEYSVAQALLDSVRSQAASHRATAVRRIHLRIGELAGIEVDLLRSAFGLVRERTIAAEAELEIVISPVVWQCGVCQTPIEQGAALRCPQCAAPARLISGDEIILERLEMEVN